MVAYTLQTMGFEAKEIEDGKALKKALAVELPELILLDIMLPGEDGLTLLKQLKADTLTRNIPVIMVTAKGAEYDLSLIHICVAEYTGFWDDRRFC